MSNQFADYRLEVKGMVEHPHKFSQAELRSMPKQEQTTLHNCIRNELRRRNGRSGNLRHKFAVGEHSNGMWQQIDSDAERTNHLNGFEHPNLDPNLMEAQDSSEAADAGAGNESFGSVSVWSAGILPAACGRDARAPN